TATSIRSGAARTDSLATIRPSAATARATISRATAAPAPAADPARSPSTASSTSAAAAAVAAASASSFCPTPPSPPAPSRRCLWRLNSVGGELVGLAGDLALPVVVASPARLELLGASRRLALDQIGVARELRQALADGVAEAVEVVVGHELLEALGQLAD